MNENTDAPAVQASPYGAVGPQAGPQAGPVPMRPQEERTWAMAAHAVPMVAWLCSAGFLGFVASLVIYVLHRDKTPFLRQHAINSLNAQLSALVYFVVSIVLTVIGALLLVVVVGIIPLVLGILGLLGTALLLLWIHINGAIKAWDGKAYDPPFTIRFVR